MAAAYTAAGAMLVGAANDVLPRLNSPDWSVTLVIVATLLGLPIAVVLAWARDTDAGTEAPSPPAHGDAIELLATPGQRKSLVVLPFQDLSPDPDDAFFAAGLTEELIADLSQLDSLRVISRTSAFSLKDTDKDVRTIAKQLDVQFVVEGSVRRSGQALRITAQLIDARADAHLWAEKYSGTLEDVFDLQEDLSRRIVGALRVSLSTEDERRLADRPIPDVRAYEHFLRARGNIYSFDGAAVEAAARDLTAGLEILGDNVLLLRGLGMALFQKLNAGLTEDVGLIPEIERCAARIANLDADDPGVFLLRAAARILRCDFLGAMEPLREAYRRDPRDTDVLFWLGILSLSTGQMDLAGRLGTELATLDPLAPLPSLLVSYHAYFDGRFDDAADLMEQALRIGPDVLVSRWQAVRTFIAARQWARARECAAFLNDKAGTSPLSEAANLFIGAIGHDTGMPPEPTPALHTWASRDAEWAQYLSDAYAFGGDPDRALSWLRTAVDGGFLNASYLRRHDPFIAGFRESPEWTAILDEAGHRHRQFETRLVPVPEVLPLQPPSQVDEPNVR